MKEIHSKRSNRENRTTFSDDPYISGVFQLDEPKNVFHLHSNRNFWNFLANGKQPRSQCSGGNCREGERGNGKAKDTRGRNVYHMELC